MNASRQPAELTLETLRAFAEERQGQKAVIELRNRKHCERHLNEEDPPTLEADQSALEDFFQGDLWKRFVEHLLPARNLIYICHSQVGRCSGESYWIDAGGNLHLVWGGSNYPIWDTRRGWNIVVSILGGTEEVIKKIRDEMQKLFNREHRKVFL